MSRKTRSIGNVRLPGSIRTQPCDRKRLLSRSISAALVASAASWPAHAQQLEEVIVTATKRAESVQDVPLAISAFSGDFTRDVNLDDVKDLVAITPGVTGNSKDSFIDVISIRGIRTNDFGVGGDPSAGFFKNNLYEGRNGAVVTSLYDMDRSEVLRGPQGFLFGRNAIGGAFSNYTRRPDAGGGHDAFIDLDVAERGRVVGEGAFSVNLADGIASRLAGYYSTEEGYSLNEFAGSGEKFIAHDKQGVRLTTVFEGDRTDATLMLEFEKREQSGSVYRATQVGDRYENFEVAFGPITLPDDMRNFNSDLLLGSSDDSEILSLGFEVNHELSWATLTSTTGYKDHQYYYNEDFDGLPIRINGYRQDQSGDYLQSELRLVSSGEGPLSWYAGASFYREEVDALFTQAGAEEAFCAYYGAYYGYANCSEYFAGLQYYYPDLADFSPSSDGNLVERNAVAGKYSGWAAYVNADFAINDRWDASLGLRYTYDKKEFAVNALPVESALGSFFALGYVSDGFLSDTKNWDDVTERLIVRYRPNDTAMLFASATSGYKSGGFGTFSVKPAIYQFFAENPQPISQADGYRPAPFEPETVWSYEIGYKDTLFDGGARVSVSAFSYNYKDLQVTYFAGGTRVDNVGKADGQGLEATVTAGLGENFELYVGAAWLDSEVTGLELLCDALDANGDPDPGGCEGSSLWWAPEFSGAAVLSADFPVAGGALTGSVETFWESERGGDWSNLPDSRIGSNTSVNLRVGFRSDNNWTVTAYAENLGDQLTFDGSANNADILPPFVFGPSRPRTLGMRFGYEWR